VQPAQSGDQVSKGIRLEVVDASLDGAEACERDRLEVVALSDEVVGHFLQQHNQWKFVLASSRDTYLSRETFDETLIDSSDVVEHLVIGPGQGQVLGLPE